MSGNVGSLRGEPTGKGMIMTEKQLICPVCKRNPVATYRDKNTHAICNHNGCTECMDRLLREFWAAMGTTPPVCSVPERPLGYGLLKGRKP